MNHQLYKLFKIPYGVYWALFQYRPKELCFSIKTTQFTFNY